MASSFYTAASWQQGKKGPPPIFASIGVRHPRNIEIDIEVRAYESLSKLLGFVQEELSRFDVGNVVIALAQIPKVAGDREIERFCQQDVWHDFHERMRRSVGRLEPRGLSMMAYALARIHG